MRDLLARSCAAYWIAIPPKAKKQKTTQEDEGSGRSHLPDPTMLAAIPAPAKSGSPPPTASETEDPHSGRALGAALWPTESSTYGPSEERRDLDTIKILRRCSFQTASRTVPCVDPERPLQPYSGWQPTASRTAKCVEHNPLLAVSSLVFASWLRDTDEPLETFRHLSICSIHWCSTRPKILWLIGPQAEGCRPPRPSVGGG